MVYCELQVQLLRRRMYASQRSSIQCLQQGPIPDLYFSPWTYWPYRPPLLSGAKHPNNSLSFWSLQHLTRGYSLPVTWQFYFRYRPRGVLWPAPLRWLLLSIVGLPHRSRYNPLPLTGAKALLCVPVAPPLVPGTHRQT